MSSQDRSRVELDVSAIGSGKLVVGGKDLTNDVIGVGVEVIPGTGTEVKLRMRTGVLASLAGVEVRVDSATAAALIDLGWTPPGAQRVEVPAADHRAMGAVKQHIADFRADLEAAKSRAPMIVGETGPRLMKFVLTWHPLSGSQQEIPLNQHWVFPAEACGEFRLSTREIRATDEPMLCDGCGSTDKPVEATDDGRALACAECRPVANAAHDPAAVVDLLALVCVTVSEDQAREWTEEQRQQAARWAGAVHLSASDNDDVEVPPRPAFLGEVSGG